MPTSSLGSSAPFFYEEAPTRILLVEGDIPTADALCSALEHAGYRVEVATSGKYGLLVAGKFVADIVLLDMSMSDMTSAEFALHLKTTPELAAVYREVPVLYLADSEWLIHRRFHQQPDIPMSDYIFKPVDESTLLARVQRTLESRGLK